MGMQKNSLSMNDCCMYQGMMKILAYVFQWRCITSTLRVFFQDSENWIWIFLMVKSLDCCCKILTWCRKDNLLIIRLAQVYVFLNLDFFVKIYTLCYTLMILNINLCLSSSEVFQTANKMKHRDLSKSNIDLLYSSVILQQCKINLNTLHVHSMPFEAKISICFRGKLKG